jgi:alkaline phosphatase
MDTASANSLVTDSAAASTAWGSGVRVNNGSINVTPGGQVLRPILPIARGLGRATGVVTTATVTHATPAGFIAHVPGRGDENTIAAQYLDERIDVILGGGTQFFSAAKRPDGRDLAGDFGRAGYAVAADRAGLLAAPAGPLLGTFWDSHLPFDIDRRNEPALAERVPALAEMTRVALDRLGARDGGFVLQVEGARVDHAAHANDIGGLLFDELAFDEALGVVLDWVAGRDDTLVIVTSDHGNANPGVNGPDGAYEKSVEAVESLARLHSSNVSMLQRLGRDATTGDVIERVRADAGVTFTAEQADVLRAALRGEHRDAYAVRSPPLITLGQLLANHLWVGWTGTAHTSDMTELAAFGPGSEAIGGVVENRALFGVMTRALGIAAA